MMTSVFVLAIGILAAISLISGQIAQIINSRSQVIAGLLAQEGMELVRNIRDNNWENGRKAFENNLPAGDSSNCIIDIISSGCGKSFEESRLYSSPVSAKNYYMHLSAGGTITKFNRRVSFDYSNTDADADYEEMKVISMVTWGGSSFPAVADCNLSNKCTYAETIFTNWKD